MSIKALWNRYNDLCVIYVGGVLNPWYLIDYVLSFILDGASFNDYFAYRFFLLRHSGRRKYITLRRYHKILRKSNNPNKIKYFRDKSEFNKIFAEQLHRESIDLNSATLEEFKEFFVKHQEVFVKEVLGCRGDSVKKYSYPDCDVTELYKKLKSDTTGHYIVENRLMEHHALSEFHPASINTLRFVTLYDNKADVVHFMSTRIRIGNNGNYVDNFHFGGIGANIDIETGIINSLGYNSTDTEFLVHPMTGKQIIGFQIPNWQECKAFVEKCARVIPEVRYVGWDVVPLENGEFALLEGNDNADHDFQQMHYHGMWPEYKKILKHLS